MVDPTDLPAPTPDPETAAAVAGCNRLAAAWARALGAAPNGSVAAAPGVWLLLAALTDAATPEVAAELAAVTGVASGRAMPAARALHRLLSASPTTKAAIGLWAQAAAGVLPAFATALPVGTVGTLCGDPAVDQPALDAWVAEHTDGELDRMPAEVTADTMLLLASALVVRTQWAGWFEGWTRELTSGAWAGRRATTLTMRTTPQHMLVTADGRVTLAAVAGRDDVDVHLFLGRADLVPGEVLATGLETLAGLHPTRPMADLAVGEAFAPGVTVDETLARVAGDQATLTTVAFDVSVGHDLLADPALFGLTAACAATDGAFPGVAASPLVVDDARQDAMAQFTQRGFVAAAVTVVTARMSALQAPPSVPTRHFRLDIDRPFGFAAVHRGTGLVLCHGWVDGSGVAALDED